MSERVLFPAEQAFFREFFERLALQGVASVLLRNYETFPWAIGNDLDIFFRYDQYQTAIDIFSRLLSEIGGEILHIHRRSYFVAVWFSMSGTLEDVLHVDFYHGAFTWHGLPYLDEAQVLKELREINGFSVPRPGHEALSLVLTSLLWGGFFKERYRTRIEDLLSDEEEAKCFQARVRAVLGEGLSLESIPSQSSTMHSYVLDLRRRLKRHSFRSRPLKSTWAMVVYWWGEMLTVIRPPGVHIAILVEDQKAVDSMVSAYQDRLGRLFGEVEIVDLRENGLSGFRARLQFALNVWRRKAKNHFVITIQKLGSKAFAPMADQVVEQGADAANSSIEGVAATEQIIIRKLKRVARER